MKRLIFVILAVLLLTALVTSCEQGMPSTAYSDTPDDVEAWQLKRPNGLQASAYDGYVYLSWEPVANAEEYSVYRSIPTQSGVDGTQDTAPQFLGTVDAKEANIYPSRAPVVGGGCTYLDYVNLDNPMQALTYRYYVVAERYDLEDNEVITIMFANSELSAPVTVAVESVPAIGSKLPAPENVQVVRSVQYYQDYYYVSWSKLPIAANYMLFHFDEDFDYADYFEIHSNEDADFFYNFLIGEANSTNGIVRLGTGASFPSDYLTDSTMAVIDSDDLSAPVDTFVVIAFPYDDYFRPSYVGFSNRLTVSDVPGDLEASNDHEDEIIVSWDKVEGADDYQLFRRTIDSGQWTMLATTMADFTEHESDAGKLYYVDTDNLVPGVDDPYYYYYKVRSVFSYGDEIIFSQYSNIEDGNIDADPSTFNYVTTPTNVRATDGEFTNKIELTWDKVDNADQYIIYRSAEDNDSFEILAGPSVFTTMEGDEDRMFYEDSAVSAGTNTSNMFYYYYVIAVNSDYDGSGNALYSAESAINSGYVLPNTEVIETTDTLAAPQVLFQNQGGATNITIQWSEVSADGSELAATGYELYVSSESGTQESTLIATINGNAVGAAVTGENTLGGATINPVVAAAGAAYDFAVTVPGATFDLGVVYYFTMKSVHEATGITYVSEPSNSTTNWLNGLNAAVVSASSVTPDVTTADLNLRINEPITGADVYYLIVSTDATLDDASEFLELQLTNTQVNSALSSDGLDYTITGLTGSTDYWYGVYAIDNDETGEESYSATETFTTAAP